MHEWGKPAKRPTYVIEVPNRGGDGLLGRLAPLLLITIERVVKVAVLCTCMHERERERCMRWCATERSRGRVCVCVCVCCMHGLSSWPALTHAFQGPQLLLQGPVLAVIVRHHGLQLQNPAGLLQGGVPDGPSSTRQDQRVLSTIVRA